MSPFEMFISGLFTISSSTIGLLLWRLLSDNKADIKALKTAHYETRDDHAGQLSTHATELQKHKLELEHSKEISLRSENEMKSLLELHNQKFDAVIKLLSESIKKKRSDLKG